MTQDEIIEMARQSGLVGKPTYTEGLVAFAKLIAQHEREACAKIVESDPSYDWHKFACEAANAIRARGQA
jgi:dTDP-4-dehydrorhamnose reductase